jgi:hypothetical protein
VGSDPRQTGADERSADPARHDRGQYQHSRDDEAESSQGAEHGARDPSRAQSAQIVRLVLELEANDGFLQIDELAELLAHLADGGGQNIGGR